MLHRRGRKASIVFSLWCLYFSSHVLRYVNVWKEKERQSGGHFIWKAIRQELVSGRLETGEAQSSHDGCLHGVLESAEHGLDLCGFWQHGKVAPVQSRCKRREEQERPWVSKLELLESTFHVLEYVDVGGGRPRWTAPWSFYMGAQRPGTTSKQIWKQSIHGMLGVWSLCARTLGDRRVCWWRGEITVFETPATEEESKSPMCTGSVSFEEAGLITWSLVVFQSRKESYSTYQT